MHGAAAAVGDADFVFMCVPTPQSIDGSTNLEYLRAAVRKVAPLLKPGAVVVDKSTVPVGTAAEVEGLIGRDDVTVVSNPEFLREGTAISDFLQAERVVVGSADRAAAAAVGALYDGVGCRVVVTSAGWRS